MADMMTFPDTVEEFMEWYKIVDTDCVYTNGTEMVPIFRMKQWFGHISSQPERKQGEWIWMGDEGDSRFMCSVCKSKEYVPTCNGEPTIWEFCPNCGAEMSAKDTNVLSKDER